jgi:hypothetical protein
MELESSAPVSADQTAIKEMVMNNGGLHHAVASELVDVNDVAGTSICTQ